MAKAGRKSEDMRQVSFRMPADVHQDYLAVAQHRGVDMSAVLNWVLVDYWPVLLLRRAEHGAAMLRAVGTNLPQLSGAGPEPRQALDRLLALIGELQDVASRLSLQMGMGGRKVA
jgi:hypothetical protein